VLSADLVILPYLCLLTIGQHRRLGVPNFIDEHLKYDILTIWDRETERASLVYFRTRLAEVATSVCLNAGYTHRLLRYKKVHV